MMDQRDGTQATGAVARQLQVRFRGELAALAPEERRALLDRTTSGDTTVRGRTAEIVGRVRDEGDVALRAFAREFDGVALESLEVPRERWDAALGSLAPALRRALERAARNIAAVHRASLPETSETSPEPGIVVGRRPDPLDRVGIYAPGGRAAYPSSVLMGAVPARIAGVREVVLCSPPGRDGVPSDVVLAAAALADVDRVFAVGGAGAIAAMAYGTATVPRVDRIVGPGNAYVAEAKLQVSGAVGIDAPAGPSELLVLADSGADVATVAREMLGQAEHDPVACAVAVVFPSRDARQADAQRFADALVLALEKLAARQPRHEIVEAALASRGGVLVATDPEAAAAFASAYAPEHLILAGTDATTLLGAVRNAGTVFVGASSSNAFGDYITGANHVLPTGGLARSYSGLSVLDFIRWTTWQHVTPAAAASLAPDVVAIAEAEGLPGHAAAAGWWAGEPEAGA